MNTDLIVYMMRGMPCCGKSYTAKRLAGDTGVVCETDEYFHTQVGTDPTKYDYNDDLLPAARKWNFERFKVAIAERKSPVVVDRGNGRNPESREYIQYAIDHGYRVEIKEPDSPWWKEICTLLDDKQKNWPLLEQWANRLSEMSQTIHRVPAEVILHWMAHWMPNLTVQDVLSVPAPPPQ